MFSETSRDSNVPSRSEAQQSLAPAMSLPTLVGQTPQRPGITHLLIFTGLFVPLVFLPYIPMRRHLLQQTRQIETLRSQLANHLSVIKENSRKLAATIDENQRLGKQIVGLREELGRIHDGITALKEGDKEKVERHQAQNEWNQKVLGAIEKMQKETKVLTPETFAQLSESLAHLAAFVELEERKNGFHQTGDDDSRGVGVMRALAMRLLEVSGMEHARAEEAVHIKYEHQKPSPQPTQQQSNTQDKKVRHEIPIRREERTEETWMW
ncbi:hypothetical protein FRC12_010316 [Ceratobasidium sp. 428]|nr:hypothetical protein FRC12_010316 [Ceratobasidium sp. 428]